MTFSAACFFRRKPRPPKLQKKAKIKSHTAKQTLERALILAKLGAKDHGEKIAFNTKVRDIAAAGRQPLCKPMREFVDKTWKSLVGTVRGGLCEAYPSLPRIDWGNVVKHIRRDKAKNAARKEKKAAEIWSRYIKNESFHGRHLFEKGLPGGYPRDLGRKGCSIGDKN